VGFAKSTPHKQTKEKKKKRKEKKKKKVMNE